MATLKDFRDERLRKLDELRKLGVDPYPAHAERTHQLKDVADKFEELNGQQVRVVGRVMTIRHIGKLAFIVIRDASGQLQLFLRGDGLKDVDHAQSQLNFGEINLLDSGDFVEASGPVIKTQTGEVSVEVQQLRLLTKALRPMPSARDGFTNKEERLRRRYIDMNVNPDVYQRFIRRSKFWQAHRDFLNARGFYEINLPVLEHVTGGADANPFVTHMDALDQDFYLRISHELFIKRLIGGGYERVYDIGVRFRNENYSDEHLPEHVAMEFNAAYMDYEQGMDLAEEMMKYVAKEAFGKLQFKIGKFDIDLDQSWPRITYADIMRDKMGVDVFNPNLSKLKGILKKHNAYVTDDMNVNRAMDGVWKLIRAEEAGPFWLIHEPTVISPLAKANVKDPRVSERVHPVIAGTEAGNGYSELNDPVDQLNRFLEQEKLRESGDAEAQMLDIDFVEMMEYGMPPNFGWGHSERYFWMLEGVTAREGVPFPQLRAEMDEVTKSIYPELKHATKRVGRPNLMPLTDEKLSEEHRLDYQLVVILNKRVEPGRAMNAAAHAVSGFIGTLNAPAQLDYLEYRDKTGELDAIISHHPTIILESADSKELLKAYRKAQAAHLPTNVFIETMTIGSSQEELEILKGKTIDELDFWGIVLYGKTADVQKITKQFQLWK